MDLSDCRPVNTPLPTAAEKTDYAVPVNLDPLDVFQFRSSVGRLLWLCPVRPDKALPLKEACRRMANPSTYDYACLKRILRYAAGTRTPALALEFEKEQSNTVEQMSDASWASSNDDRSSSGG